jgi:ankyrin repeat protein
VDSEGRTALFLAVKGEQRQLVQLLIERGAAVNTGDATGITPLHLAVKSTVIAAYLLEQGADPHAADHNECTPLYYAAFAGSAAVVNLLLEHGADDSAVNSCGRKTLFAAVEEGHINVLELLAARGRCKHSGQLRQDAADSGSRESARCHC